MKRLVSLLVLTSLGCHLTIGLDDLELVDDAVPALGLGGEGGGPTCALDGFDSTCAVCAKANCCPEVDACAQDANCTCWAIAFDAGATPWSLAATCGAPSRTTMGFHYCAQASCSPQCTTSATTASSSSAASGSGASSSAGGGA